MLDLLPKCWLVLRLCLEEQAEVSQKDSRGVCGMSPWRCLTDDTSFPVSKSFSHSMSRIEIGPVHQRGASVHSGPPKGRGGALYLGNIFPVYTMLSHHHLILSFLRQTLLSSFSG